MIIFLFFTIIILFSLFFKLYGIKKILKNKKITSFNKNNLDKWMNLSKKERYNLSKKDSVSYLNKRKVLLDKIRKEYKIISKRDKKIMDS
tara:strand:+ start:315 stop:584 length:270 start_codon:yes stop_codon:yes gene_type:complete